MVSQACNLRTQVLQTKGVRFQSQVRADIEILFKNMKKNIEVN
jgi:nucleosome binding factor SPN SPT16 subunit